MNSLNKHRIILYLFFISVIFINYSCATTSDTDLILATVNEEQITKNDLIYSLTITHRKEDLTGAGSLDISKYIQKLIDDKLIINEARIASLDKEPEIQEKVKDFIIRESVTKLHQEEILSKIKENDYKTRKEEEKRQGDEYLKILRNKAEIKINKDILNEIINDYNSQKKLNIDENSIVASVNSDNLIAKELFKIISSTKSIKENQIESLVDSWINRKLVDQEALKRNYMKDPKFYSKVKRYEDQLLKNLYIKRIIVPKIKIDDNSLINYYENNKNKYIKPQEYKIRSIITNNETEAKEILNALNSGADFSWFLKRKSSDSNTGEMKWLKKENLPEVLRKIIDNLKEGEISPVLKDGEKFLIVKLYEKSKVTHEPFENVKENVFRDYFNEELKNIMNDYLNNLRKDTKIHIIDKEVKKLEEELKI